MKEVTRDETVYSVWAQAGEGAGFVMPQTFNDLLIANGLDPAEVTLVRHAGKGPGGTTFELWRDRRNDFEEYQRKQRNRKFNRDYIAVFVSDPTKQTLFVGVYRVNGVADNPPVGWVDPISLEQEKGVYYDLTPDSHMAQYSENLLIDWGPSYPLFVQSADRNDKPVVED